MTPMPEELKGYKCPDKICYECEFRTTKCIVYSTTGKKKYAQWKKEVKKNELSSSCNNNKI